MFWWRNWQRKNKLKVKRRNHEISYDFGVIISDIDSCRRGYTDKPGKTTTKIGERQASFNNTKTDFDSKI